MTLYIRRPADGVEEFLRELDCDCYRPATAEDLTDEMVYAAARLHMEQRGIDLEGFGVKQAMVPDECRWMRAALTAALFAENTKDTPHG